MTTVLCGVEHREAILEWTFLDLWHGQSEVWQGLRLDHVHVGLECLQDLVLLIVLFVGLLDTLKLSKDLEAWDLRYVIV